MSNGRMILNDKCEEAAVAYLNIMSLHLFGEIEKINEKR